jgi:hypothetical protein
MSTTNTSSPLPKIKLKLQTMPISTDNAPKDNVCDVKGGETDAKSQKKKTAVAQESGAKKKKSSLGTSLVPSPALTSEADPVTTMITTGSQGNVGVSAGGKTGKRRLPGNIGEGDGLFGDYVSALKTAIAYQRTNHWTLKRAQLRTATGYALDLTEWCTKRAQRPTVNAPAMHTQPAQKRRSLHITIAEPSEKMKSSKPAAIPASQAIKLAKQDSNTFVCTHEGCHRIFDDHTRWRRHQNGHIRHTK